MWLGAYGTTVGWFGTCAQFLRFGFVKSVTVLGLEAFSAVSQLSGFPSCASLVKLLDL